MTLRTGLLIFVAAAGIGAAATWNWLGAQPFAYQVSPPHDREPQGDAALEDEDWLAVPLEISPIEPPADAGIQDAGVAPAVVQRAPGPRIRTFKTLQNYLLVGVDHTRSRNWGRADTLMVASFDDQSGHVGVVSIPRDLYVEIPDHGPARINATLRVGTRLGVDPLALLSRVVEDTLAIPIHHTVVGNLEAFEDTVDALGGIHVSVRCPIQDNFVDERTESGRRNLKVEAGEQHFDGVTAAMYVRSRHGRSDWDRARRQQAVLLAIRNRIRAMSFLDWVPVLTDALDSGVTTTMSRWDMIQLARRISQLAPSRIHGMLIGSRQITLHRTEDHRSVLLPNLPEIDKALAKLFEAPLPGIPPRPRPCKAADAALR